jgi:hypothetical protein
MVNPDGTIAPPAPLSGPTQTRSPPSTVDLPGVSTGIPTSYLAGGILILALTCCFYWRRRMVRRRKGTRKRRRSEWQPDGRDYHTDSDLSSEFQADTDPPPAQKVRKYRQSSDGDFEDMSAQDAGTSRPRTRDRTREKGEGNGRGLRKQGERNEKLGEGLEVLESTREKQEGTGKGKGHGQRQGKRTGKHSNVETPPHGDRRRPGSQKGQRTDGSKVREQSQPKQGADRR